jgi:hypothetical protein
MLCLPSRAAAPLPHGAGEGARRPRRAGAAPSGIRLLPVAALTAALLTLGAAAVAGPSPAVLLLAAASVVLLGTSVLLFGARGFPALWQTLAGMALAGYIVLSWGFTNLAVPGTGIPVGHVLGLTALGLLAARSDRRWLGRFFKEPTVFWWLLLVGLTAVHLIVDLPRYGAWAVRDASVVLEGIFLLLGFLWATRTRDLRGMLAALAGLFLVNTVYSLTYPMAATVTALSPVSGIFRPAPVIGSYTNTPVYLAAGAFFFLLVARHLGWPRAIILSLALFQFAWSLVFQSRYAYLGLLAALAAMGFVGRARQSARLATLLAAGVVIFFVLIAVSGVQLQGRIGEVDAEFLWRHLASIFLVPDTPAVGSAQWRLELLPDLIARWTASRLHMFFGEGFGLPIIDFHNSGPNPVRQPHDTHLTFLVRLGAVGLLIWLVMQWTILKSLVCTIRRSTQNAVVHDLASWLLVLYVLLMIMTTFEPELEFSYGAIPFYTFMGFALGLARQLAPDPRAAHRVPHPAAVAPAAPRHARVWS